MFVFFGLVGSLGWQLADLHAEKYVASNPASKSLSVGGIAGLEGAGLLGVRFLVRKRDWMFCWVGDQTGTLRINGTVSLTRI